MDIPVHNLGKKTGLPDFEVLPWRKEVSKYNFSKPHRHGYYEILVFLKGGGLHEIDFNTYGIKSRSLHFVAANQVHEVKRTKTSEGYSLLFTESFLPSGYELENFEFYKSGAYPTLSLNTTEFRNLQFLLNGIHQEYFDQQTRKRETIQSLLQLILLKAQRIYLSRKVNRVKEVKQSDPLSQKFQSLIKVHLSDHWRAKDYALQLNITVGALNSFCKRHFSKNTESFIQNQLITEIKRLLVYTDKSVKEICFNLNFDDPAYFTRFFKKKTGLTPIEYRNAVNQ